MFREITLGQYYPEESVIHRLDPRTKLAGTMIYLVSLFMAGGFGGYALAVLFLCVVIYLSRVPFGFMTRGLRSMAFVLLFSVIFNIFLTPGEELFSFGFIRITREGLSVAGFMALRLVLLVLGSTLLTLTTTPGQITDGLEQGLRFLNRFGIPVHEISMMMSIALRFIPILIEETDRIMSAQTARGADFSGGGIIAKAKSLIPVMVPLFVSSFRRASELAQAMESRCYCGGKGRTRMNPLKYRKQDIIAYILLLIYFISVIVLSAVK